jgi:putative tryptophan/tyrosine transport system substrate-binding protein
VQTRIIVVRTEDEIETAFATFAREGIGAVFVANSLLFFGLRELLAVAAARHRVPASYELREHVDVGGLMSYGPNVADVYRQVGRYTGRILKGEKPADLPVMLPTRFEFVLNLKAVKVLGLTIPPGVLAIVDEVIE